MRLSGFPSFNKKRRRPTVLLRSIILVSTLLLVCAILWATALALFLPKPETRFVLPLALIAWTLGLRHALDSDHIIAIDSVTRNLVSQGQLPVTCGTYFSLGHSTIVIAVTIAVIISVANAGRLGGVAGVGAVIGVSVSASFLLILALINLVMLISVLRKTNKLRAERPNESKDDQDGKVAGNLRTEVPENQKSSQDAEKGDVATAPLPAFSCIARVSRPFLRSVNRPWKMYPVGILFGFGFDTSSEIALLGVSALSSRGNLIPPSHIILLPLLFTSGMSLVDSLDSVLMLFAYAVPEGKLASEGNGDASTNERWWRRVKFFRDEEVEGVEGARQKVKLRQFKEESLISVSILLTTLSILVAFLISLTEFMGLAATECRKCAEQALNDPGLAGRWWRFWNNVNSNSGYLGAGVVAIFAIVFGSWGISRWLEKQRARRGSERRESSPHTVIDT